MPGAAGQTRVTMLTWKQGEVVSELCYIFLWDCGGMQLRSIDRVYLVSCDIPE